MTKLMNKFGLAGYAAYFILMEMCAKKLEKEPDQLFTEEHCRFVFNERLLREKLRMKSTKVELLLNLCSTYLLLQFTKVDDEFNIYVPKLLEYLDRDSKRARTDRDVAAPKNKIKNKEEDKERESATSSPTHTEVETFSGYIRSSDDLVKSVPIHTKEKWRSRYSNDDSWIDAQIRECFDYHWAEPAKRPKTLGAWQKKLHTWFQFAEKNRASPKAAGDGIDWDYVFDRKKPEAEK